MDGHIQKVEQPLVTGVPLHPGVFHPRGAALDRHFRGGEQRVPFSQGLAIPNYDFGERRHAVRPLCDRYSAHIVACIIGENTPR